MSLKKLQLEILFGCLLIFFAINFRRIDELTGLPGGSESILYFGFNIFLLLTRSFKLGKNKEILLYFLWFIWVIIACHAPDANYVVKSFWSEVRNMLLVLVTFINITGLINSANYKIFAKWFIISTIFLALLVILDSGSLSFTSEERLSNDLGLNTNELGYYVTLSTTLLIVFSKEFKKLHFVSILVFFAFITIILASRKALVSQLLFILFIRFYMVVQSKKNRWKNILKIGFVCIVMLSISNFVMNRTFIGERLQRTQSIEDFRENEYQ